MATGKDPAVPKEISARVARWQKTPIPVTDENGLLLRLARIGLELGRGFDAEQERRIVSRCGQDELGGVMGRPDPIRDRSPIR